MATTATAPGRRQHPQDSGDATTTGDRAMSISSLSSHLFLSRSRSRWVNLFLFDFVLDVFLGCFFNFVALMLIDDMFLLVDLSNRNRFSEIWLCLKSFFYY